MILPHDICRCWSTNCEKRDTCARWTYRTESQPHTGHHDHLCGPSRHAYIPAERYPKDKAYPKETEQCTPTR